MKKVTAIVLILTMVICMTGMAGCTKVGETAQTTQPVATAAPAPAATAAPADAAPAHEPFELEIYTLGSGTSTYILGVALADIINQNSTWLHATALSSQGVNATAQLLIGDKAECAIGSVTMGIVVNGLPPFTEPNYDLCSIASYNCTALSFITLNPELTDMKDLDGKKVMLGTPGAYLRKDVPEAMFEYLNIHPEISYGNFTDAATALMNGDVDAIYIGGTALNPELTEWSTHSSLTEVASRYQLSYISVDLEATAYAEQKLNMYSKPDPITIPAGMYDPGYDKDLTVNPDYLDWVCNKKLDPDVVTEIIRIMDEHSAEFSNYIACGSFITLENMAGLQMPEYVHPAAKAYYEAAGVWNH